MTASKKYREFWIEGYDGNPGERWTIVDWTHDDPCETDNFHVIEHQAYEDMKKERDEWHDTAMENGEMAKYLKQRFSKLREEHFDLKEKLKNTQLGVEILKHYKEEG